MTKDKGLSRESPKKQNQSVYSEARNEAKR